MRRPPIRLRPLCIAGALIVGTAGCAPTDVAPAPSVVAGSPIGPAATVGAVTGVTHAELVRALGTHNLVLADAQTPFRPAEGPAFTTAPRAVYQVILPDDPTKGFIVVYEFADPAAAAAAGADQAAYLASGPGRIQSPDGEIHILRQVGATVVYYSWIPEGSRDARAPEIQAALEGLGVAIAIPG